jgi:Bacterial PH domain
MRPMPSDDELQRWLAAGPEHETVRERDPVLGRKALRRWELSGHWRALVHELRIDELVEAGVAAGYGRIGRGLLVLTDRRVLYASERVTGRPQSVSIERTSIRSMTVREAFRHGTIHVETRDSSVEFPAVRNEEAWDFVGHWLAGDGAPNDEAPMVMELRERPEEVLETLVTISHEAEDFIAGHGGSLFLWQEGFNATFAIDKVSTHEPTNVEFMTLSHERIAVRIGRDVPRPHQLDVSLARWPRRRVRVTYDGERWGRRGFDLGDAA